MKHLILILTAVMLILSCQTRKIQTATDAAMLIKDSTVVIETIRYDTVILLGDTVVNQIIVKCDSLTLKPVPLQVRNNADRLRQVITIDNNGKLTAECHTDSLLHIISVKDKELAAYKAMIYTKNNEKQTVTEKCTRHKWRWYSIAANIGLILWAFRKPLSRLIIG